MHWRVRLGGIVVLSVVLVGLCAHAAASGQYEVSEPGPSDLVDDYEAHVGEKTLLFGRVVERNSDAETATIVSKSDGAAIRLTATPFRTNVQPGGSVQIYGEIRPTRTIRPERVVVVNPASTSKEFKYVVSALGAVVVLGTFFGMWTLNRDELAFEVRTDG